MPVENIGAVQQTPPPGTDNRTEPAASQTQASQQMQQSQQTQQPQRAPLPEASGWNVDLFA